ncbi:RNA polymerase sigma factor [Sphingomonas sp. KC8]|uniref:RNA polymerase sigma factor n=1 Tax=Sphingomonas sp. KC8 TaxID=1030157 RepID=UPI000248AB99|nr:sigma-70 family RNA polymerase sigma factor [Sphingomonas sp. KC8]
MDEDERALWLSRHILPHELSVRRIIGSWNLPHGLDLEDIIQESYAKIAGLPSVLHISAPKSYFLQIARSILLMHVRRAKLVSIDVIADLEQLHVSDETPSPEEHVSDREQLRLLAQAVAQMDEPHRTVFVLRMIHEWPHKAIGQKLGLSENAVQKILARTLNALAGKIGRGGKGGAQASGHSDNRFDREADNDRHER